jgi:hypothetical protein
MLECCCIIILGINISEEIKHFLKLSLEDYKTIRYIYNRSRRFHIIL